MVDAATGTDVYQGDTVETGGDGSLNIVFSDGTSFSLGTDGQLTIDEMVYDPATAEGSSVLSIATGAFSLISGQLAKTDPEAMVLNTPIATIGIRGTAIAGLAGPEGSANTFTLLPEPGGFVGEILVANDVGFQVMNVAFQTTQMASAFIPPATPVIISPAAAAAIYGSVSETFSGITSPDGGGDDGDDDGEGDGEQTAEQAAAAAAEAAAADAFEAALAEGASIDEAFAIAGEAAVAASVDAFFAAVGQSGPLTAAAIAGSLPFGAFGPGFPGAPGGFGGAGGLPGSVASTSFGPGIGFLFFAQTAFLPVLTGSELEAFQEFEAEIADLFGTEFTEGFEVSTDNLFFATGSSDSFTFTDGVQDEIVGSTGNDTITVDGSLLFSDGDRYILIGGSNNVVSLPVNAGTDNWAFTVVQTADTFLGAGVTVNGGDMTGGATQTLQIISDTDQTNASATESVTLNGGSGVDVLRGGGGNDTFRGFDGADRITTNGGSDIILYNDTDEMGSDAIADFTSTSDKFNIDVSGFSDATTPLLTGDTSGMVAATFTVGGAATVDLDITAAGTVPTTAGFNFLVFSDPVFNSAAAIQTALQGGANSTVITYSNTPSSGLFLAAYDDGSETHIAAVTVSGGMDTQSGGATVSDLLTIENVSDVTAFDSTDLAFVA